MLAQDIDLSSNFDLGHKARNFFRQLARRKDRSVVFDDKLVVA